MPSLLNTFFTGLLAICRAGTLVSFAVLVGVVTLQVLGRIPGVPSPSWTEEVARFALVYMVAFSCGIAVLRAELVNVDMFVALLPVRVQQFIARFVDLVLIVFSLAIIPGSWRYVIGSFGERARSIDVPMITVYVVTLIIPVCLALFALARLLGYRAPQTASTHSEVR
jgi:TRAP-type transport system small permease protein